MGVKVCGGRQVVCEGVWREAGSVCVCMYNLSIHVCKTFAHRVGVRMRIRSEGEDEE